MRKGERKTRRMRKEEKLNEEKGGGGEIYERGRREWRKK